MQCLQQLVSLEEVLRSRNLLSAAYNIQLLVSNNPEKFHPFSATCPELELSGLRGNHTEKHDICKVQWLQNWNSGCFSAADCCTNNAVISARIPLSPSSTTASTPSSFPSGSTAISVSTSGRAGYYISSSSSSAASTPASSNATSHTSYSTNDWRTTAGTPSSSPSSSTTTSAHGGCQVSYSTSFPV
ncbi:uncharacterized protein LOC133338308 [Musca vetustissima]|uniref:uncharacterized protein LOC133338308 n=1 Tax=Musca vetustissima TaxID=27455 RepID=UPI002AB75093|nr:uncharacterized protein LOC133338308 [Musca vetustissima]